MGATVGGWDCDGLPALRLRRGGLAEVEPEHEMRMLTLLQSWESILRICSVQLPSGNLGEVAGVVVDGELL